MAERGFRALLSKARQRDRFWVAKATQDFTEALFGLMERRGVNKAELARRIDSSPAYITKALQGNTNFTIGSMVRLVRALDGQLCIHVAHREDRVHWFHVLDGAEQRHRRDQTDCFHHVSRMVVTNHHQRESVANDAHSAAA
jgi:hypothetical protein